MDIRWSRNERETPATLPNSMPDSHPYRHKICAGSPRDYSKLLLLKMRRDTPKVRTQDVSSLFISILLLFFPSS